MDIGLVMMFSVIDMINVNKTLYQDIYFILVKGLIIILDHFIFYSN